MNCDTFFINLPPGQLAILYPEDYEGVTFEEAKHLVYEALLNYAIKNKHLYSIWFSEEQGRIGVLRQFQIMQGGPLKFGVTG